MFTHRSFYVLIVVTLLVGTACAPQVAPPSVPTSAPVTTEAIVDAPTHSPEKPTTQTLLGVFEGSIAFRSNQSGNDEIYVMKGDGCEAA
jgi:hypothetical protein